MADELGLAGMSCVPCRGGIPPLDAAEIERHRAQVPDWSLCNGGTRIERRFGFGNFADALAFVGQVGTIAEAEQHHPDVAFGWGYATVSLQTHAIKGLHANDFIVAAKIDRSSGAAASKAAKPAGHEATGLAPGTGSGTS